MRGFSLLEMLMAISLLALLASLSVPRMQSHSQRAMRLQAQAQLVGLAGDVAAWRNLYARTDQEIRNALPEAIYSDAGEMLYTLRYEVTDGGDWTLVADSPPTQTAPQIRMHSDGSCRIGALSGQDRPC